MQTTTPDPLKNYTDAEHARALGRLAADMDATPGPETDEPARQGRTYTGPYMGIVNGLPPGERGFED